MKFLKKILQKTKIQVIRVSIGKDQAIKEYYYLILNVYLKRILLLDISLNLEKVKKQTGALLVVKE